MVFNLYEITVKTKEDTNTFKKQMSEQDLEWAAIQYSDCNDNAHVQIRLNGQLVAEVGNPNETE